MDLILYGLEEGSSQDEVDLAVDSLLRIIEAEAPLQGKVPAINIVNQLLRDGDYWDHIAGIAVGYVADGSLSFDPSNDSALETLEEALAIRIKTKDIGNGRLVPHPECLEDIRGSLEHLISEYESGTDEDVWEPGAPVDEEINFSGFIRGEPKTDLRIKNLIDDLRSKKIIFPKWQRKSDAWTPAKKQNLVRSLLLHIPLPSIILHIRADGKTEVVDGRQRLNALMDFFDGKFKTARFSASEQLIKTGALPEGVTGIEKFAGKFWDEIKDEIINLGEDNVRSLDDWINGQIVPSLVFEGLTKEQLYYIFAVYNTNTTPLNAAEIRNAVYHDDPLHISLMKVAGDLEDEDSNSISSFDPSVTEGFRTAISPSRGPRRFAASEAMMRAWAFARIIPKDDGTHRSYSPAKAIQDTIEKSRADEMDQATADAIAKRMLSAYQTMRNSFDNAGIDGINRPTPSGTMRYNRVRATTMHVAFLLLDNCRANGLELDDDGFDDYCRLLTEQDQPEKQSGTLTWGYHLIVISEAVNWLIGKGVDQDSLEEGNLGNLVTASLLYK